MNDIEFQRETVDQFERQGILNNRQDSLGKQTETFFGLQVAHNQKINTLVEGLNGDIFWLRVFVFIALVAIIIHVAKGLSNG